MHGPKNPTIDRNIDRETLRIFAKIAFSRKNLVLRSILFPIGVILQNVVAPLFIGKTLAALAQPNGRPLQYLVWFCVAAGTAIICNRLGHLATMQNMAHAMRDAQHLALETLLKRSVGFHNNNIGGKLVSDAADYPTSISKLMDAIPGTFLPFSLTIVFGTVLVALESWPLGLCLGVMATLVVGLGIYDSRRMEPHRRERLRAGKAVTGHLADAITNVQTVKTFGREPEEMNEHNRLAARLTNIRLQHWSLMSTRGNTRIALLVTLQALFVFITILVVRRNPALLGVGIFAFAFTITLSNRLFEVNMLIRNIEDALLDAAPMTTAILETPEVQDAPGAGKLQTKGGAIDLHNVTFRYEDANQHETVFAGLNLHIKPGEKIGLVGPSGGGKSTFTRLLLRFEDIQEGEIAIDGQNIAQVTQKSLRQQVAYVPQEPLLFHRSVNENIAYGKPHATKSMIAKAAASAHAAEFIDKLPHGYDTIVGERGVKLSGGQRQRVAIARAILKDAPILVLDEATSALDSESEVLIQKALWQLMEGRTAIVIAHRLSTIQKMDRILVLDNGTIVEEGTHKTLLKQKGLYAKLWSHQSGGFIED